MTTGKIIPSVQNLATKEDLVQLRGRQLLGAAVACLLTHLGCEVRIMNHQIFLSYPVLDQDLVENFTDRLLQNGVKAWVYSIDKTLSAETWDEIKTRIAIAELFAFAASVNSRDSSGQHRELQMAIEKVTQDPGNKNRLLPIMIDDLPFSELPPLLNAYNVASTAEKVAGDFFPDLLNDV